jgi:hypothetical protein
MTPLVNSYTNKKIFKLFKITSTWSDVCITLSREERSRVPPECITLKNNMIQNLFPTFFSFFFSPKPKFSVHSSNIFSDMKKRCTECGSTKRKECRYLSAEGDPLHIHRHRIARIPHFSLPPSLNLLRHWRCLPLLIYHSASLSISVPLYLKTNPWLTRACRSESPTLDTRERGGAHEGSATILQPGTLVMINRG